jgi:hypothetical protein
MITTTETTESLNGDTLNNAYFISHYYPFDIDYEIPEDLYKYELTITFNPNYYPLGKACNSVKAVIREIMRASARFISAENKKILKELGQDASFVKKHYLEYCVEYHKPKEEGRLHYPHIHGTLHSEVDIPMTKLEGLVSTLRRKFGRTTLYYTDQEDRIHENDHFKGKWS